MMTIHAQMKGMQKTPPNQQPPRMLGFPSTASQLPFAFIELFKRPDVLSIC